MQRNGYVNWPRDLESSGENGMWVCAIVPVASGTARDPLLRCVGPEMTIALPGPDVLIGESRVWTSFHGMDEPTPLPTRVYEHAPLGYGEERVEWQHDASTTGVLAALVLDTTSDAWTTDVGYWFCTRDDLTTRGIELVTSLCEVYRRPVTLATYLDT